MNHDDSRLSPDNMMSFILHQDNLMWSRIQTIAFVQLAALSAAYSVRSQRWLATSLIGLGLFLTFLLFGLLRRDEMQRSKIHDQFPALKWTVGRKWYSPLTGRETTWVFLVTLLITDLLMGLSVYKAWL